MPIPANLEGGISPTNASSPTTSVPFADLSDVILPKSHRDPKRRASFSKKSKSTQLKDLPPLNDTPMQKREVFALFVSPYRVIIIFSLFRHYLGRNYSYVACSSTSTTLKSM